MAMKVPEFVNMTRECSLTVLVLYATFLSDLIRAGREDPAVRDALQSLNQIIHTGVALNKEDEEWAYEHKLRITVCTSLRPLLPVSHIHQQTSYGTTETGQSSPLPVVLRRAELSPQVP